MSFSHGVKGILRWLQLTWQLEFWPAFLDLHSEDCHLFMLNKGTFSRHLAQDLLEQDYHVAIKHTCCEVNREYVYLNILLLIFHQESFGDIVGDFET